ncbi:hypothetical protein FACS1894166_07520 [Bacilli bacterium]|nr:hypothetical protein FACS1894166_07520 [Bacilli bacterium]
MSFVDVMYAIQTGANYLPGNKFEFVGYDACLMAGYEQAYLLRNSTKYIINSEDSEPGNG